MQRADELGLRVIDLLEGRVEAEADRVRAFGPGCVAHILDARVAIVEGAGGAALRAHGRIVGDRESWPAALNPNSQYYETNTVFVRLNNGVNQRVDYDTNLHPMRNQYLLGPSRWSVNASAFKSVELREGMALRFNIDFFNAFNMPGTNMPDSTSGILSNQFSDVGPRVLQVTGRLTW